MARAGIWVVVESPAMAHSGHRGGPDLPKYEYDSLPQRPGSFRADGSQFKGNHLNDAHGCDSKGPQSGHVMKITDSPPGKRLRILWIARV